MKVKRVYISSKTWWLAILILPVILGAQDKEQLTPQQLAVLAKTGDSYSRRMWAVVRLSDADLLADVALHAIDDDVSKTAIDRIDSIPVLSRLTAHSSSNDRRYLAFIRLKGIVLAEHPCSIESNDFAALPPGTPLGLHSSFWYAANLPANQQAEIRNDASAALQKVAGASSSDAVLELFVFGYPLQHKYLPKEMGFDEDRFTAAEATGFVRLRVGGRCLYSRRFETSTGFPVTISDRYRSPEEAPFRQTMREAFTQLASDLAADFSQHLRKSMPPNLDPIIGEDKYVKAIAISHLEDQTSLAQIAIVDSAYVNRSAALDRIHDSDSLLRVFDNVSDCGLRYAAAIKLNRQEQLAALARSCKEISSNVEKDAVARLTDPALLIDLASNGSWNALERITSPADRAEVACHTNDPNIARNAIAPVRDQKLRERVAVCAKNTTLRINLIRTISDRNVLMGIARTDPSDVIREETINSLSLPEDLVEIALNDHSYSVRRLATTKAVPALTGIAISDTNEERRRKAFNLLLENAKGRSWWSLKETGMAEIAKSSPDVASRAIAIGYVADSEVLRWIAKHDPERANRQRARDRLKAHDKW